MHLMRDNYSTDKMVQLTSKSADRFIRCRIGVGLRQLPQDLDKPFNTHVKQDGAEFIVIPIQSMHQNPKALLNLFRNRTNYFTQVAIDFGEVKMENYSGDKERHVANMIDEIIFYQLQVILINCPKTKSGMVSLAQTINHSFLKNSHQFYYILIKVTLNDYSDQAWSLWNSMRNFLDADPRVGVCLSIESLARDEESHERWTGEPVRMIVLNTDMFHQQSLHPKPYLEDYLDKFVKKLMTFNSHKTCLVVQEGPNSNIAPLLRRLKNRARGIYNLTATSDRQLSWHDRLLQPLQPLSSNLSSSTYEIFEDDSTKYVLYADAMIEALQRVMQRPGVDSRQVILMVLGAGRGPLVDRFCQAIQVAGGLELKYRIYALDKNKSSVQTLKHKNVEKWSQIHDNIQVEVVKADMRSWNPGVKADIIVTELLGSFGDNELSPECVDGLWPITTRDTILIPQEYTSYVAPICSYKMRQQIHTCHLDNPFDRIYVVNLVNCYYIDKPKKLFTFRHYDISIVPETFQNERFAEVTFTAAVDTTCHGFAGFFIAKLYGSTVLSTVQNQKTPSMDSWFPAFIPLEQPVSLKKGTSLTVLFWRKIDGPNVWYQWAVVDPVESRVHSPLAPNLCKQGTMMPGYTYEAL